MTAPEPTNAQRADWARNALAVFTAETYSGDHPDSMEPGDLESAIGDLICDLLHFAARQDMEARTIHEHGRALFEQEVAEEDRCDCRDRSWYGTYHDTQCPLSIKADAASNQVETSDPAEPISYWLDALFDINRLAGKSGDHEADPWALLDLIAHEARAAINKAVKQ